MTREIPVYFDSVIVGSPIQHDSAENSNIYHLKVRVFTKYANRNGSYISDGVADQLIESATQGITPVIGFFDPETQTWASHTGPTLAKAYGYVDSFDGWQPFTDTDGVTRDYAVFSVTLFAEYFEEVKTIAGQNQSMELNPTSIEGDWAEINGEWYYVYTKAKMLGFCIIGQHEPCFSVSAFFSNEEKNNQLQEISSLLFDLKEQVEKSMNNKQGGEQPMDEFENKEEIVEETPVEEVAPTDSAAEPAENFEQAQAEEVAVEEPQVEEPAAEPSEFEVLQQKYDELNTNYTAALEKINELEASVATLIEQKNNFESQNTELQAIAVKYNTLIEEQEIARKNSLVEKYEKMIGSEEIDKIRDSIKDFSYDELEGKLAIIYANKQMLSSESHKVPLPEPQESQFALLMKKYRKN